MKRISISLLLAALAVGAWAPRPAAAATEVGAQVSCTEAGGAPSTFVINTDSASYDSLVSAAQAMAANPSGMTCTVSQTAPQPGNGSQNFAVGGGQFIDGCGTETFAANFAISAHSDADGTNAEGTINLTFPENQSCFPESHETGSVYCLKVIGNTADFSGPITHATGAFVNNRFFQGHATDNGEPQNGQPVDTLSLFGSFNATNCAFHLPGQFPLSNGNIVVHQGS